MNKFLHLSFRYKVPLWGAILIVAATLAVVTALMVQAYDDLENDMRDSSGSLSRTLAKTLFPAMENDEMWRAYEIIKAPLHKGQEGNSVQPRMIFALDMQHRIFAASEPRLLPPLDDLRQHGEEYARLTERIADAAGADAPIVYFAGAQHIYVASPIEDEGTRVGTLVVSHSKDVFISRFTKIAWRGIVIGLIVLAVLLPINWYWGQRMAVPLSKLVHNIDALAHGAEPRDLPERIYAYQDELGQLFEAYRVMVKALREKVLLEEEMIRSERLAAVGRLSAGIAHEINNPLGGMLVALDNFKRRSGHDERTSKTISLLERGISQIRETVSAMLVEAKVKSREVVPHDVEDVQTLLSAEARKRAVTIQMNSFLEGPVAIPATPVRQILINLLLNAIHASEPAGIVYCNIRHADEALAIQTENHGHGIPPDVMAHLFEPSVGGSEAGHGLGLWVTYQIASQLRGHISASSENGTTRFFVSLPTGEHDRDE